MDPHTSKVILCQALLHWCCDRSLAHSQDALPSRVEHLGWCGLFAEGGGCDVSGAKPIDVKPAQPMLPGSGLQQPLRPSSTSPASPPARSANHMRNPSNAALPPILEQLKSLTSFKRLDEQHLASAACKGISVPVQQSLPASFGAERRIQAVSSMGQVDMHPGSGVPEDLGHPPSCRAVTRSARSPAEGGPLIAN